MMKKKINKQVNRKKCARERRNEKNVKKEMKT